jgi:CheY-like chemotaxis protein
MLHFCVSDTGIGIAPEVQARLFSRFEQGHEHDRYGGTGLGLSIARQLVTLMEGRMWLESERGQGSRFHFTIATTAVETAAGREIDSDDTVAGPRDDADTVKIPAPVANPARAILLVEDDPVSAIVASTILESAGFSVAIANHGAEAVELWRSQQFSCVLSDMRMPVMNGLELAQTIRRHEQQQGFRTPIIIVTASGQPAEHKACAAAGIDAYLTKPLRSDELLGAIRRLRIELPEPAGER